MVEFFNYFWDKKQSCLPLNKVFLIYMDCTIYIIFGLLLEFNLLIQRMFN